MRSRGRSKRSVNEQRIRAEVCEILQMWAAIERTYAGLSADDQKRVKIEADPFGESVKFDGFSANEEFKHFSAAVGLIKDEGRFGRFYGRELDSHVPCLDEYRGMLGRFQIMPRATPSGGLSVADLIALLKERGDPHDREQ